MGDHSSVTMLLLDHQIPVCWILDTGRPVFMHEHICPTSTEPRLDPDFGEHNYCLCRRVEVRQLRFFLNLLHIIANIYGR